MSIRQIRLLIAVLLLCSIFIDAVFAAPAPLTPVPLKLLSGIDTAYMKLQGSWFHTIQAAALSLFWHLATVDFAWSGVVWVKDRKEMGEIFTGIVGKIFTYGFFGAAIISAYYLIPMIIGSFTTIGKVAAGLPVTLTPDLILGYGLSAMAKIIVAINSAGFLASLVLSIPLQFMSIMIGLCFAIVAGQFLVTLVESYICIGAGVIMLGFGGSRWTTDMATSYFKYAVAVGVKLMLCYLIVGAGVGTMGIFSTFTVDPDPFNILGSVGELLLQTFVFAYLVWNIPSFAASLLSGSASSSLGGAVGAAVTMGAAVAGVGGAAMSVSKSAASSLKEATGGGGDSRDALGSGPGSISGSGPGGGFGGPDGGSKGGGGQSGVGPSCDQPPKQEAKPEIPASAQEAMAAKTGGAGAKSSPESGVRSGAAPVGSMGTNSPPASAASPAGPGSSNTGATSAVGATPQASNGDQKAPTPTNPSTKSADLAGSGATSSQPVSSSGDVPTSSGVNSTAAPAPTPSSSESAAGGDTATGPGSSNTSAASAAAGAALGTTAQGTSGAQKVSSAGGVSASSGPPGGAESRPQAPSPVPSSSVSTASGPAPDLAGTGGTSSQSSPSAVDVPSSSGVEPTAAQSPTPPSSESAAGGDTATGPGSSNTSAASAAAAATLGATTQGSSGGESVSEKIARIKAFVRTNGDAAGAGVSGADKSKDNKDKPQNSMESLADKINRLKNFTHSDGANVSTPGISMGHTKD